MGLLFLIAETRPLLIDLWQGSVTVTVTPWVVQRVTPRVGMNIWCMGCVCLTSLLSLHIGLQKITWITLIFQQLYWWNGKPKQKSWFATIVTSRKATWTCMFLLSHCAECASLIQILFVTAKSSLLRYLNTAAKKCTDIENSDTVSYTNEIIQKCIWNCQPLWKLVIACFPNWGEMEGDALIGWDASHSWGEFYLSCFTSVQVEITSRVGVSWVSSGKELRPRPSSILLLNALGDLYGFDKLTGYMTML